MRIDGSRQAPVPPGEELALHLRLLSGLLADAPTMQAAGRAAAADIDTAMRSGAGHAQGSFEALGSLSPPGQAVFGGTAGPLTLIDLIGVDVTVAPGFYGYGT